MTVGVALRGVIFLVAAGNVSGAQGRSISPDPAQVVRRYLAAVAKEQWNTAAQDIDLQALDDIRRELLHNLADTAHRSHLTVEELMKADPEMPRAVAEYQVRSSERDMGKFNIFSMEFAGVKDPKMLAELSKAELAARWVRATGMRYQLEEISTFTHGCSYPDISSLLPDRAPDVIGSVVDGRRAYVLVDIVPYDAHARKSHQFSERPVNIYQLRNVDGHWKILPTHPQGVTWGCSVMSDSANIKSK